MKTIYTWFGGYSLHKCNIMDEYIQGKLEVDDMLPVIGYLIDTDQIDFIEYDNLFNYFENEEEAENAGWIYFDNTESIIKPGLYYTCIENLKVIEDD